jgi:hypothetical protein
MTDVEALSKWFYGLTPARQKEVVKFLYGDARVEMKVALPVRRAGEPRKYGMYCGPAPSLVWQEKGLYTGPAPTSQDVRSTRICPNCGRPM